MLVNILNQIGSLPTRNFREGYFPTADKTGGEIALEATLLVRPKGCFSCVISCGRVTKIKNPKYASEGEGPEYEAGWCMGADCAHRRPGGHHQGQSSVQRAWNGQHFHGRDGRVRDGSV